VEINAVAIGKNTSSDPIYLANDYYDEPDKREEHYLWWIEPTCSVPVPWPYDLPCFGWINHGVWLDPAVPGWTYLRFKDHGGDFWVDANVDCKANGLGRLDAVVEGIDIIAQGIDPDEEEGTGAKNYNIFLNENFDQQLGSGPCYNVDHSDDTLTGDQMDEIGTITINTYTYGDNQATVRFNSGYGDNIKLFKSQTEKVFFDFDYPASEFSNTTLYVEGIESGTTTLTAILRTQEYPKVEPGDWPFQARDKINIKVHRLNLEAVNPAPFGEDDEERDRHEICDVNLVIAVNNNDSDNDGIIDSDPSDTEITGGDPDFAKITLQKPDGTSESDITGSITVTIPANLNAWKTNDKTGGAAPTSYALTDLPVDIYLEGKTASSAILDTEIKAEMTLNSGVKCRDEIHYTVIKLDILKPKGSLDAAKNPETSWISSPCYHFDFQGLISGATGPYVLDIQGYIDPAPPVGYKWTLDEEAGTLANDTTATPTHTAPATEDEGMLTLKATINATDTDMIEERKVKIYKDHLERDYANFGTGGSCLSGWKVTTFNVDPQPTMLMWNCHGSTNHACSGYGSGSSSDLSNEIKSWDKDTFDVLPINWSNVQAVLDRGDVVAYYAGSSLQHSATCSNSTTTWGANNEPVNGPETWKWYLATPQDWWNNAGTNNPPLPDCTKIIVYNKP